MTPAATQHVPRIALMVVSLNGCAGLLGVSGGPSVVPTARTGASAVGGALNAHMEVGAASGGGGILVGAETNARGTADYGHGDVGFSLAALGTASQWMGALRVTASPFGFSTLNSVSYYTPNFGTELTLGYARNARSGRGVFLRSSTGRAMTLSLRMDIEWRPETAQTDLFLSLLIGMSGYSMASLR